MFSRLASRHPRLLLVAFCLLCWLPGFFTIPATDRDEARFAQATKQMLESGDFLHIRNGSEERNRKPAGIYWLQAPFVAAAQRAGLATTNPVWPYRLPSLLGALLAVLTTHAIGRRLFDTPTALLAAAMLGGCALLTVEAHLAKTDAALLGASTLVMALLARAYLTPLNMARWQAAGFWVALAAGILLKGPVAPLVAGLTAATLSLVDWRARWLLALRPGWGVPLCLVLTLPWLAAIELATQGRFLAQSAGGDLWHKLVGGDDAHGAAPGYHLAALSLALFPVGFVVLRALPASWRGRREKAVRFLLAWAGPAWLVFEAIPTKLPHYVLPLYPALCLLAARWVCLRLASPRWLRVVSAVLFVVAGCGFGLAAVALPWVIGPRLSWLALTGVPGLVAAGLVLVAVLWAGSDDLRAAVSALAVVPLLWWALLAWEIPHAQPLFVSRLVAQAAGDAAAGGLASVGYAEPSLRFATSTGTQFLDPAAAARFLHDAPGRVAAVVQDRVAGFLRAAGTPPPRLLAAVRGFDYSNGRRVLLNLYAPP